MYIHSKIVWVLNLAPDSFSDGKIYNREQCIEKINYLINSWSDIIDIGAESTAPWSQPISLDEELWRLEVFFGVIENFSDTIFSLDTMKAWVAKKGIEKWVKIINDVSGGRFDEDMFSLISQNPEIKYVFMYAKNESWRPDLKENKNQEHILEIVMKFFEERILKAEKMGIRKEQIILDPWMGAFISTDYTDSVKILQNLQVIKDRFNLPLFVWTSRKWFLGKLALDNWAQDRLGSSLASSIFACFQGVDFIRVHDVRETKQFIDCWNGIQK
jgi:dihydropteroate synthase